MNMIFTDGASRGNPGKGGWGAVLVLDDRVKELGGREDETTNNRMELTAVIEALVCVIEEGIEEPVTIYTDSSYVVKGATQWSKKWVAQGWMTSAKQPVLNKDLWVKLVSQLEKVTIKWALLPGHSGIAGNERADEIATNMADKKDAKLFHGTLVDYPIDISNTNLNTTAYQKKSDRKERSKAKAYSYLSLVDGVLMRHRTWATCEARVKGKKARFKKALSPDDEQSIVEEWGYSQADIING